MGRAVTTLGIAAVFAAGIGLGAGLTAGPDGPGDGGGDDAPVALHEDGLQLAGSLAAFDGCADYLDTVQQRALEVVGPWGLQGGHPWMERASGGDEMVMDDAAEADMSAGGAVPEAADGADAPTPSAGTTPDDVSGTNVQEEGVDEPDRVKTDGEVVYTAVGDQLRALDITGDEPVELDAIDLDGGGVDLLLAGDRLLVTSGAGGGVPFPGARTLPVEPGPGGSTTTLTAIDVSDPGELEVVERLTLDGATLSARMVDGVARVVITTAAGAALPWEHPEAGGLRAERQAQQANEQLIRDSEAADWLPYYVHETVDADTTEGSLLSCERVAHPDGFAGLGTVSVLTVDVADGPLTPDDGSVGVLTDGRTVYASPDRLYVATERWIAPEVMADAARGGPVPAEIEEASTAIHAFDTSSPTRTEHLASGEVPGQLLSQWSLSEHEGVLRVASTIGDAWWGGGQDSSSLVTTLRVREGELTELGQVGDLGPTERIFAVRFLGDVGYVVTFRQTDPLYVIDLSDPTTPRTTGELKIEGYSAYLHPLGEGRLLGVGQDADPETGMTRGTQVSLFDVSDPTDPRRTDTVTVPDSASDVEGDHRAFLHWPATGLNVIPVTRWWHDPARDEAPEGPPNGALALRLDGGALVGAAGADPTDLPLSHADPVELDAGDDTDDFHRALDGAYDAAIERSLVVGDRLLTFSRRGVVTHDLDDLSTRGELAY